MNSVTEILDFVEEKLGVPICVHDYTGRLWSWIPGPRLRHSGAACVSVKAQHLRRCLHFEQVKVEERLENVREAVWKRCHAGFLEVVRPIYLGEKKIGAIFAGPWRGKDIPAFLQNLPERLMIEKVESAGKRAPAWQKLPPLEDGAAREAVLFLGLAAAFLERRLGESRPDPGETLDRKTRIEQFLDREFHDEVQLSDLAGSLGLSASRASQIVRGLFGKTFPELLAERRLSHARILLSETAMPVTAVARHSGFTDPKYFYRRFKERFGMSARVWKRSRQGADTQGI
ncbi:MAG: helix-turn-helix domain-containing protein [Spirochaetia bacterium]|nr:helix-turn-helix domain-containing protein [Spirochaetia bacterium]